MSELGFRRLGGGEKSGSRCYREYQHAVILSSSTTDGIGQGSRNSQTKLAYSSELCFIGTVLSLKNPTILTYPQAVSGWASVTGKYVYVLGTSPTELYVSGVGGVLWGFSNDSEYSRFYCYGQKVTEKLTFQKFICTDKEIPYGTTPNGKVYIEVT